MAEVAELCSKCSDLRVLKLFGNQLDDSGAERFSEIFRRCQKIEEVHLSHNHFTNKGVEAIVAAADKELPKEDAPRPLWLRLENNRIDRTHDFVRDILRSFDSVCVREDRNRCTPRACVQGKRIHLPFFAERPKGSGRGGFGY